MVQLVLITKVINKLIVFVKGFFTYDSKSIFFCLYLHKQKGEIESKHSKKYSKSCLTKNGFNFEQTIFFAGLTWRNFIHYGPEI